MKRHNNRRTALSLTLVALLSLALAACGALGGSTETTDPNQVTDIVWEWETLRVTTGFDNEAQRPIQETTTVPNPEVYTLILREDGTFEGQADCSGVSGTYTSEGGYMFSLGPSAMIFCGEESLEPLYRDMLGRVVAGGPDGAGGFALETAAGAERMEFRSGGPAPQP